MTATEMEWPDEFIYPYPSLYPLYLFRNIHLKNVRFPWNTLYKEPAFNLNLKEKACIQS